MMPSIPKATRWVALGALVLLYAVSATAQEGNGRYESIFREFYRVGIDPEAVYSVSNLTLRRDNMKLQLKSGLVFLLKPLEGEVTGAVFIGSGLASMKPVNRSGRYMLSKYYGKEQLAEPFDQLFMRFSDGAHERIKEQGRSYTPGEDELKQAREILKERSSWLDTSRSFNLEDAYLERLLSDLQGENFFLATFRSAQHGWLTYIHDPGSIHENGLFAYGSMGTKSRAYLIPWTIWHTTADYGPKGHYLKNPERDGPRLLRIKHNEMEIDLKDTHSVRWKARLLVEPLVSNMKTLTFDLANNADYYSRWYDKSFNPVEVESVTDVSGHTIDYTHRKDQLMVYLPRLTEAGTPITLEVRGRAEVIYQLTAESFGFIQVPWYPQYGYLGGRASFDWTIRVPRPFLVTGSGTVVKEYEDKERRQNVTQLKSDIPVTFPLVIFGRFKKAETEYVSEESGLTIPLTMHSFPTMTIPITDPFILWLIGETAPISVTLSAPPKKVRQFFDESKEVLKLYEKLYGPYPYEQLHIAQMAPQLNFGQAPPGFLQLTGAAFLSQARLESDFLHGFLAHEIAHQWWGNQVGWASGDDVWLSEAFAEYASGIFQHELQGPKRFQRTLQEWRQAAGNCDREAPIAAASTLRGPNAGRHRTELLYNKGPYILHMLRIQLDDEKYMEVMRSVQDKYRHRGISTEQFLTEVNRVSGANYTYFFDQWFWDVGIPKFRYTWRSEKRPDGKFLITVHVSQEDKEHVKRVLMPIHIHFKKQTIPQYRPVIEAEQDIQILSPMEPKDVTLDDDRTLLAEFVKQR